MKTQGEIEAAVGDGIARSEQEFMGRGPKDIRAHVIDTITGEEIVLFTLARAPRVPEVKKK